MPKTPKNAKNTQPRYFYRDDYGYIAEDEYGLGYNASPRRDLTDEKPAFPFYPSGSSPREIVSRENAAVEANAKMERLPKDCGKREDWEKLGFVFAEDPGKDPLFVNVKFPAGWKNDRDPRDYRNIIVVDDKGRKRASGFLKDTSYDRCANMSLINRFSVTDRTFNDYTVHVSYVVDKFENDYEKHHCIHVCEPAVFENQRAYFDQTHKEGNPLAKDAIAWLDAKYPDWRSPAAYWDEPKLPEATKLPDYRHKKCEVIEKKGKKAIRIKP